MGCLQAEEPLQKPLLGGQLCFGCSQRRSQVFAGSCCLRPSCSQLLRDQGECSPIHAQLMKLYDHPGHTHSAQHPDEGDQGGSGQPRVVDD